MTLNKYNYEFRCIQLIYFITFLTTCLSKLATSFEQSHIEISTWKNIWDRFQFVLLLEVKAALMAGPINGSFSLTWRMFSRFTSPIEWRSDVKISPKFELSRSTDTCTEAAVNTTLATSHSRGSLIFCLNQYSIILNEASPADWRFWYWIPLIACSIESVGHCADEDPSPNMLVMYWSMSKDRDDEAFGSFCSVASCACSTLDFESLTFFQIDIRYDCWGKKIYKIRWLMRNVHHWNKYKQE